MIVAWYQPKQKTSPNHPRMLIVVDSQEKITRMKDNAKSGYKDMMMEDI